MRDKGLATAAAAVLAAFAVAHLMQFGLSAGRALSLDARAAPVGPATWLAAGPGPSLPPTPAAPGEPAGPAMPAVPAALRVPGDAPVPAPPDLPSRFGLRCDRALSVEAAPGGLLRLRLAATCDPGVRVEIGHAGLRFALSTGTGLREVVLPALAAQAEVTAVFADGSTLVARAARPAAVEGDWLAVVVAGGSGVALRTGAAEVHRLGDADAPAPVTAEVHRLVAGRFGTIGAPLLEVEVTERTCGRDVVAEVLWAGPGAARDKARLRLAMPDCGATGEVVALPLPAPGLRIAGN